MQSPLLEYSHPKPRLKSGFHNQQPFEARLRHFSIVVYSTPAERARRILPKAFAPKEILIDGRPTTLISVISHLDLGSSIDRSPSFEQTSYRISATLEGREIHWLLGVSIGSLSALSARGLWLAPAHLGAMEFQISYCAPRRRYSRYRLSIQSRWENADWNLADADKPLDHEPLGSLLAHENFHDYFVGRDGVLGTRQIKFEAPHLQRGTLVSARSELLTRLELLSPDELSNPLLVGLANRLVYKFDAPHSHFSLVNRPIFAGEEFRSRPILGL